MNETQFTTRRRAAWAAWDRWLSPTGPSDHRTDTVDVEPEQLPSAFRALCHDLSIARDRQYSRTLQDALHSRVLRAHQRVYQAVARRPLPVLPFVFGNFPRLVRREWRPVLLAAVLLFGPMIATTIAVQFQAALAHLILPPSTVASIEAMYSPTAEHLGRPREATTAWMMWAFYVANNVRIDFQCFAGGAAAGLGSVFFLIYNGLFIGAVAGHLTRIGDIETFWGFVAGHSAFELTGAALSGAAGLIIGGAIVSPGRLTRVGALKRRGAVAVRMLAGAALLTFLAAFVEAFWSPTRLVPTPAKYAVGLAVWVLVAAYFAFVGRARRAS